MRDSLALRMLGGTGLLAILMAAICTLMVLAIHRERDASKQADAAQNTVTVAGTVLVGAIDMESGMHGYLATGDEEFLGPYKTEKLLLPGQLAQLRHVAVEDPLDAARITEIESRTTNYVRKFLDPAIELAAKDLDAARDPRLQLAGKRHLDELRPVIYSLVGDQQARATAARERADKQAHRAVVVGIAGTILLVICSLAFMRYLTRRILNPVRRIEEAASQIAAGDLGARVPPPKGTTVVDRMGEAFNTMADSVEESRAAMVEAERGRDEFFGVISHELRTPLTSVVGYLELMLEDEGDELPATQRRKYLEVINRNSRRLLRLVGDLLFVARMEAGRVEFDEVPFDLAQAARDSLETLRTNAEAKGVTLRGEISDVGEMTGDMGRMGQAFDNLLNNAVKFTPEGGEVVIRVSAPEGEEHAVVEVADTGIGIPENEQRALFDRFFRAEDAKQRSIEGTGLGLAIVKTIVEGHGGEIVVESTEGKGTTFRLLLPLSRQLG